MTSKQTIHYSGWGPSEKEERFNADINIHADNQTSNLTVLVVLLGLHAGCSDFTAPPDWEREFASAEQTH